MKTLEQRFWPKVDTRGICWEWTAARGGFRNGYGVIGRQDGGSRYAHRVAWELLVGPIPEELTIDHLCRNTLCVNPDHMEIVPRGVNTLRAYNFSGINSRKTHCKRGHAFDSDNTHLTPTGRRNCRACDREYYHRKRADKNG